MIPPCSLLLASGLEKTTFESAVQSPLTSWSARFLAVLTVPCRSPFCEVMTSDPFDRRHLLSSGRTSATASRGRDENSSLPLMAVSKLTV